MPVFIPIFFGVVKVAALALTAYEVYSTGKDVLGGVDQFGHDLDKAKKELEEYIKDIKEEIGNNISAQKEVSALKALASKDPQRPATKKASGKGSGKTDVDAAIEQKIPFRKVISKICDTADMMPVLNVRKNKDAEKISPKKLIKLKKEALEYMIEKGVEQLPSQYQNVLSRTQLKQFAADLLFEYIDKLLEWKSPLKCEVCFSPPPEFKDPKMDSGTKLKRSRSRLYPFFPAQYRGKKGKSSITADLVIPDYRKEPVAKDNLFAIIEIKFPSDPVDPDQIRRYKELLDAAVFTKTTKTSGVYKNIVKKGGRLALFRYPIDRASGMKDPKPPASAAKAKKTKQRR